jgi:hypothetical protein
MLASMNTNFPVGTADGGSYFNNDPLGAWTLGAHFFSQCLGTEVVVCRDNHPGRRNGDVYLLQGDQRRRGECARAPRRDVLLNDRGEDRRRVGSVRAEPAGYS